MKRRRARDLSPEFLYTISGIGPKGRIRKKGVDAYKARGKEATLFYSRHDEESRDAEGTGI
jgi:pyruvate/2-oxoglutarate dehydrogenase complex dihydrolipoamide acyltransferase (E2) component